MSVRFGFTSANSADRLGCYPHNRMYTTDNTVNAVIAGGSSIPTWLAVINDPSAPSFLYGVIASVILLFIGKLFDLAIRVVMDAVKRRRGDGSKTNSETKSSEDSSEDN